MSSHSGAILYICTINSKKERWNQQIIAQKCNYLCRPVWKYKSGGFVSYESSSAWTIKQWSNVLEGFRGKAHIYQNNNLS